MPNISVSLSGENPNDPITEINCGQSTVRVGGDVNISLFPELTGFYCTGFDIKSINISGNKKLKRLEIFDNKITQLPSSLEGNTGLNYFDCSKNNINGSIPNIGFNSALTYFNCSGNNFTGFQGTSIDNNLRTFYANNNKLYSPVVDKILNAVDLNGSTNGILDLSNGNQPPSITNIKIKQVAGTSFSRLAGSFEVTVTLADHGYVTNDILTIQDLPNTTLNGTFIITVISPSEFRYTSLTSGLLTGSGTATIISSSGFNDGFKKYQNLTLPISQGGKGWNVKIPDFFIKQLGGDISKGLPYSKFGTSVDINDAGNRIIVGDPEYDNLKGTVQVFEWDGDNWNTIFDFTVPYIPNTNNTLGQARLGRSVSINGAGNVIVIGAPTAFLSTIPLGIVLVYKEVGGVWVFDKHIWGESPNEEFGYSISLNSAGDRFAVGTRYAGGGTKRGEVSIYSIINNTLIQLGGDIQGSQLYGEEFGTSVSLNNDGDKLLVGSPNYQFLIGGQYIPYGITRLYEYKLIGGQQAWTLIENFFLNNYPSNQQFGRSVSLKTIPLDNGGEKDIIAVGVPFNTSNAYGLCAILESDVINIGGVDIRSTWSGYLIEGEIDDRNLGYSVSLSNSGNYLVVGAPFSFNNDQGQFRIYKKPVFSEIYFNQIGIGAAGVSSNEGLGASVSIDGSGNRIVVGGPGVKKAKVYELLD